ncbi:rod shape-determining protein MreD [Flavicella sediminum]|uniref:rod shape-determining protein MreD n=1 Tax=Flavicella sediminum TaxID=2585141 RepID=UPI00111CBE5F|nr:rod shape-determining protein MreD [Flavicella sediminum]
MTRDTLSIAIRFIFLLLLQVLVLNNINFFGYINPNLYILFVFLYPLEQKRTNFLIVAFLLGLCVDFFSNSGGINAAATLFIAYIRLYVLKLVLNKFDIDYKLFKLTSEQSIKIFIYIATLTFAHHFILFYLDYFSFKNLSLVLYKSFTTSIFTIILSILSLVLITKKKTV